MLARPMTTWSPLARLQNDTNRLFEGFFEDMPSIRPYSEMYPGVNIWEDAENAWLEAELPGLTMNDIEVLVTGNELTINGERRLPAYDEARWHRRERSHGRFSRTMTLPWEIDGEHVEARFHDGVLSLRLPKAASSRPRKIQVQGQ